MSRTQRNRQQVLAMRALRQQRYSEGLNAKGFKRVNKPHPELAGLNKKAYHREYMRWQRAEDRKGWENLDTKPCPPSTSA